jgi:hypothetical protein
LTCEEIEVTEEQYVDSILLSISSNIKDDKEINDSTLHKIVYDVAEDLGLPITRSWYKFGTFIWTRNCWISRLNQFDSDPNLLEETGNLVNGHLSNIYSEITAIVRNHPLMHDVTLREYLLNYLYSVKAQKEYKNLYKNHKIFIDRIKRILDGQYTTFPEPQYILVSKEVIDFHREMVKLYGSETYNPVIDFTNLITDLVIKYDSTLDEQTKNREVRNYLATVYNYYLDEIWTLPASINAIKSVKGPRKDEIQQECESNLELDTNYEERLEEFLERSIVLDIYPSRQEILNAVKKFSSNLENDGKDLDHLFVKQLIQG